MKFYDDTTGWDLWTLHPNTTYSTNYYINTVTNAFREFGEKLKKINIAFRSKWGSREWHRANHLAVTSREFPRPLPARLMVYMPEPTFRKCPSRRGHTGWVRRGTRRPL